MMGFYTNFLTKAMNGEHTTDDSNNQAKKQTTREKLDEKLNILKQKQGEMERQEKERRLEDDYNDDPFNIKKAEKPKIPSSKETNLES